MVALQRWRITAPRLGRGLVTLWGLLVFIGLTVAFGLPLVDAITHLANTLPGYVSKAEHGQGWIGHLVRRYHVQQLGAEQRAPKLVDFGKGLASPALSVGKGAFSLLIALLTIFVLTLLLLLEGPKMRAGAAEHDVARRGRSATRGSRGRSTARSPGTCWGTS